MNTLAKEKSLLKHDSLNRELFIKTDALLEKDRCDACASRALVRAIKDSNEKTSELLFCGHHGNKNVVALLNNGWSIDDQSYIMFEDPTTPEASNNDAYRPV